MSETDKFEERKIPTESANQLLLVFLFFFIFLFLSKVTRWTVKENVFENLIFNMDFY